VDPKAVEFIHQSSYVFAGNNPVKYVDVNGEGPDETPSNEDNPLSLNVSFSINLRIGGKGKISGSLSAGVGINVKPEENSNVNFGSSLSVNLKGNTIGTSTGRKEWFATEFNSSFSATLGNKKNFLLLEPTYTSFAPSLLNNEFKTSVTASANLTFSTVELGKGQLRNPNFNSSLSAAFRTGDLYFMAQNDVLRNTDHGFGASHYLQFGKNISLWSEISNGTRITGRNNVVTDNREYGKGKLFEEGTNVVIQNTKDKRLNMGRTTLNINIPRGFGAADGFNFQIGSESQGDMAPQRILHKLAGWDQFIHNKKDFNVQLGVQFSKLYTTP